MAWPGLGKPRESKTIEGSSSRPSPGPPRSQGRRDPQRSTSVAGPGGPFVRSCFSSPPTSCSPHSGLSRRCCLLVDRWAIDLLQAKAQKSFRKPQILLTASLALWTTGNDEEERPIIITITTITGLVRSRRRAAATATAETPCGGGRRPAVAAPGAAARVRGHVRCMCRGWWRGDCRSSCIECFLNDTPTSAPSHVSDQPALRLR